MKSTVVNQDIFSRVFIKLKLFSIKALLFIVGAFIVTNFLYKGFDIAKEKTALVRNKILAAVTVVNTEVRWITKPERNLSEIILEKSRQHKISEQVIRAMILTESTFDPDSEREEPGLYDDFVKYHKIGMTEREKTRFNTSYGLMQVVYGYWFKLCDLKSPIDLFNKETNLECGLRALKYCRSRAPFKDKTNQWLWAFACYNQGERRANIRSDYVRKVKDAFVNLELERM